MNRSGFTTANRPVGISVFVPALAAICILAMVVLPAHAQHQSEEDGWFIAVGSQDSVQLSSLRR